MNHTVKWDEEIFFTNSNGHEDYRYEEQRGVTLTYLVVQDQVHAVIKNLSNNKIVVVNAYHLTVV